MSSRPSKIPDVYCNGSGVSPADGSECAICDGTGLVWDEPTCERDHEPTYMESEGTAGPVEVFRCPECGRVECR